MELPKALKPKKSPPLPGFLSSILLSLPIFSGICNGTILGTCGYLNPKLCHLSCFKCCLGFLLLPGSVSLVYCTNSRVAETWEAAWVPWAWSARACGVKGEVPSPLVPRQVFRHCEWTWSINIRNTVLIYPVSLA